MIGSNQYLTVQNPMIITFLRINPERRKNDTDPQQRLIANFFLDPNSWRTGK